MTASPPGYVAQRGSAGSVGVVVNTANLLPGRCLGAAAQHVALLLNYGCSDSEPETGNHPAAIAHKEAGGWRLRRGWPSASAVAAEPRSARGLVKGPAAPALDLPPPPTTLGHLLFVRPAEGQLAKGGAGRGQLAWRTTGVPPLPPRTDGRAGPGPGRGLLPCRRVSPLAAALHDGGSATLETFGAGIDATPRRARPRSRHFLSHFQLKALFSKGELEPKSREGVKSVHTAA